MTITGDSFGYVVSAVSVVYSDGTVCKVKSVSMTSITCVNRKFLAASKGTTLSLTITVNGETDSTISV